MTPVPVRLPVGYAACRRSTLHLLALLLVPLAGCDEAPTDENDDDDGGPTTNVVMLDRSGTLAPLAEGFTGDTFSVTLPEGRALGVIFESEKPLAVHARVPGSVIHSPGGTFAAVIPIAPGRVFVRVQHGDYSDAEAELDYRLRFVAVREAPEHAARQIEAGDALVTEWVDLPLDIDEFTIDFEQGERFYIEAASDAGQEVTVRLVTPGGAMTVPFVATSTELTPSATLEAQTTGEHVVRISNIGLTADVAASYRFRVVRVTD